MLKLCIIYNFAPKYREGIFQLIDQEYDCDWYFGNNKTDIKGLDLSMLKSTKAITNKTFIRKPLYYQVGVLRLLFNPNYSVYLMLGELFCISTWLFLILKMLFYPRKRIYFWSHGWYGRENWLKKRLKKLYFNMADGTFLYGNHAKQLMLKEGFQENKLFVIHNSLNYDKQLFLRKQIQGSNIFKAHFRNNNKNLIFIGRLTKIKHLDLLIDALVKLQKQGIFFNLTLVGDGSEKSLLCNKAQKAGLDRFIWFYGSCYDESINAELIFNSDLCVAPGNVGLTAMHVMVYGTPVITHDSFSYQMPEFEAIVPNKTGDFFQQNNADSLAICIHNWFLKNEDRRDWIRQNCYDEIDQYWTPNYQLNIFKKHLL